MKELSALLDLDGCGLHRKTPYGITNVTMTQFSIARHYGVIKFNGETYVGNNILDSVGVNGQPPFQRKRKAKVTIIIGIICNGGIVVASDSQTTFGTSKTSSVKMARATFQSGEEMLLAQSGEAALTSRWIEIVQDLASFTSLRDYRTAAECVEKATVELKQKLVAALAPEKRSAEELRDIYEKHDASLMFAFYYGGTPYIFTVDFSLGIANKKQGYGLLGCGATVAEFILSSFKLDMMPMPNAASVAIYAVEEVKKVDAFCGGQTRAAYISKKTGISILSDKSVNDMVTELNGVNAKIKTQMAAGMNEAIIKVAAKWAALN